MLKHATVIDATVGRSSRIGVEVPGDDDEGEDEQRARGVMGSLRRWLDV